MIPQILFEYSLKFNNYNSAKNQKNIIQNFEDNFIQNNQKIKNNINIIPIISPGKIIGFNNKILDIKILFDSGSTINYIFNKNLIQQANISQANSGISSLIIIPITSSQILYLPVISETNILIKNTDFDILIGYNILKLLFEKYNLLFGPNTKLKNFKFLGYHTTCKFNNNIIRISFDTGYLDDEFDLTISCEFYNKNKNLLTNSQPKYNYKKLTGLAPCPTGEINLELLNIKFQNLKFIVFTSNLINPMGIPVHLIGSKKLINLLINHKIFLIPDN